MKKYVLLAVFLCFGCQTYQERIEEYRARCSYIYGYQNPDATAFCIQNLEAQDDHAQAAQLRELDRNHERFDRDDRYRSAYERDRARREHKRREKEHDEPDDYRKDSIIYKMYKF